MLQVVILMAVTLTGFLPNVVTLSCEDPPVTSDKLLTFMSMFNGKFEIEPNSELPLRSGYYYYRPVNVPALEPALSIFMEAKRNNKLVRRQLLAVTEEEDGSIHVQVYNFTETTVIRDDCDPMTVFAGLEMSDLTTKDECEIVVQQKRKSLFRGHWNNCRKSVG